MRWGEGRAAKAAGVRDPETSITTSVVTLLLDAHRARSVESLVMTVLARVVPLVKFMLEARGLGVPQG